MNHFLSNRLNSELAPEAEEIGGDDQPTERTILVPFPLFLALATSLFNMD
jgi:hypothetical protein